MAQTQLEACDGWSARHFPMHRQCFHVGKKDRMNTGGQEPEFGKSELYTTIYSARAARGRIPSTPEPRLPGSSHVLTQWPALEFLSGQMGTCCL